jgi:hypothetical protein
VSLLLPRLSRADADALIDELAGLGVEEIAAAMPADGWPFVYAPVGGVRAEAGFLDRLRELVLTLASASGYPHSRNQADLLQFDANCACLLQEELPVSPHEAAHREVWACLTAAHLLDVAVWRWEGISDRNRVNGHLNRDTFRRLWWRAELLHDPALPWDGLGGLGEDEIVAITERPRVTGNPELARAIVRGFRARLEADPGLLPRRMLLMREGMKRLTRLTPFTAVDVLGRAEIDRIVEDVMEQAATAVSADAVSA